MESIGHAKSTKSPTFGESIEIRRLFHTELPVGDHGPLPGWRGGQCSRSPPASPVPRPHLLRFLSSRVCVQVSSTVFMILSV